MKSETQFQKQAQPTGSHVLRAMASAGYSNTRPRQAVIDVLSTASASLNPVQILESARRSHPHLGLVTVYRTLDILAEMGLVRKVHLADGCHSYALVEKTHGHHVICTSCQQLIEFEGCDLSAVLVSVERQTGFAVTDHWLEMFGLCPQCQRAKSLSAKNTDDTKAHG